tara:strand:+ start:111 stop:1313 length:1203 start_codon:yes stop_codon:yes gene_type:complete
MKCKITSSEMSPFMSFGKMPIANGFLQKENFKNEFFFDLEVGFSEKICLFQLKDHPTPEQMFNENYPFFTGSSQSMKAHFKEYADFIKKNFIKNNSKIIEIGSNDGTFLNNFKDSNIEYIGFEPSSNVAKIANLNGINTLNQFFGLESLDLIKKFHHQTNVIFAANVICHIPKLVELIKTVDQLLSKDGVFIFEEPYLGSMFEKTSYDQIYDEHIFMFSISSVKKIFNLFNFDLINIQKQKTHGGSMRYVIARKGEHKIKNIVKKGLNLEKKVNIDSLKGCLEFKKNCEKSKKKLRNKIFSIKKKNKSIAGYAATSKSTTILNYCGIDNRHIDFICDTTSDKIGKFTPKTHIPIVNVDYFRKNLPDFTFLFAWNHKEEIFKKEKKILKKTNWIAHIDIKK